MTSATSPRRDWSLRDWFSAPNLPTRELRRQARALWMVSWPFLAIIMGVLGIAVLVQPETLARRAVTVAAVTGLIVLLHAVSRRGRPALASWMLVIGLSLIVTQRAWITGGIHAPVAVFYLLFIIMGGVLLGARAAVVTAMVCTGGALALTAAEYFSLLEPSGSEPIAALTFVMLAIGLALGLQGLITASQAGLVGPDTRAATRRKMSLDSRPGRLGPERWKREVRRGRDRRREEMRSTGNVLELSRLQAGQVTLSRTVTDVGAIAQEVVAGFKQRQANRDLTVVVHGDPISVCDPELTARVVHNLVGNAVNHTPRSGRVVVLVSAMPDRVRIAVSDEGPGLPAMMRSRIFDSFAAQNNTLNGLELSGVGLAFCRAAVEAQGGTIRVEDLLPKGSIFIVELPG